MNSLFLALDWFGLAQDFLALPAGLAHSALSSCLTLYSDPVRPGLLACWHKQTDGAVRCESGGRTRDTQTENRTSSTIMQCQPSHPLEIIFLSLNPPFGYNRKEPEVSRCPVCARLCVILFSRAFLKSSCELERT